jgi:hypothetical protein
MVLYASYVCLLHSCFFKNYPIDLEATDPSFLRWFFHRWQLVGTSKYFWEEYTRRRGIFIVLKTINNDSSLEPLLISFISSCSQQEMLLILLALMRCGSS